MVNYFDEQIELMLSSTLSHATAIFGAPVSFQTFQEDKEPGKGVLMLWFGLQHEDIVIDTTDPWLRSAKEAILDRAKELVSTRE